MTVFIYDRDFSDRLNNLIAWLECNADRDDDTLPEITLDHYESMDLVDIFGDVDDDFEPDPVDDIEVYVSSHYFDDNLALPIYEASAPRSYRRWSSALLHRKRDDRKLKALSAHRARAAQVQA